MGESGLRPLKRVSGTVHSPWTTPGVFLGGEVHGITTQVHCGLSLGQGTEVYGTWVPAPMPCECTQLRYLFTVVKLPQRKK